MAVIEVLMFKYIDKEIPMNGLIALWKREPALIIGFVDAVIVLAVTLGAPIDPQVKAAVDSVLVAAGAILTRSQVSPTP